MSNDTTEPTFIQPNIEYELPKEKRNECREIVREIKNFGVSQRQLLYLIQLLSMELENIEIMKALTKVIGESRKDIPINQNKVALPNAPSTPPIPGARKKIIVPTK